MDMPNDLKILLEFMRVKAPELNIRQSQLARIIFIFFILNIFLFLMITDGIGSVSLRLKNPVSITELIYISEPRVFVVLGTTLVIFFYFVRFGYLYLQSVKEVASTHNVIDGILPFGDEKTADLREALMQTCRSNYIVQTIVVFLYTPKTDTPYKFIDGPLSGSTTRRGMFIKFIMILTTIAVEWIIAVSQFMMIVVFLAFTKWIFSILLFFAFSLYYGFYFEYIMRAAWRLRGELWIVSITGVAALLIVISSVVNLVLLSNYEKSPNVFLCRMTLEKISEISPPATFFVSFLFKDRAEEQAAQPAELKSADVPLCKLGKN
jgi:hypothetical protein